jgi:hypothetical protein
LTRHDAARLPDCADIQQQALPSSTLELGF